MKYRNWFMKYHNEAGDGTGDGGVPEGGAAPAATDAALPGTPAEPPKTEPAKGYWPEDWQTKVAKGDEKLVKLAQRYASPEAAFEALVAAQNRIRSGELKPALPKDAKPEELSQWRKDNGIPETPDKYDLTFDSGLVIGDDDKPIIDGFLKAAHEKNMTPEHVKSAVEWYYQEQERQANERAERDENERTQTLDVLNEEWGAGFRRNVNMIEGVLAKFPEGVREAFKAGRLADGTAIFNHPDILRGMAALALEINPAGTLVPANGADPMKGVEEAIAKIEGVMRTNRTAYNKDEKMQAEYRQLLEARGKMQQRA